MLPDLLPVKTYALGYVSRGEMDPSAVSNVTKQDHIKRFKWKKMLITVDGWSI
jgi:hypothetical protein